VTSVVGAVRQRFGSLLLGIFFGALCGALIGGVLGRLYMRLIFLGNQGRDGAVTDFGTAGQFTVGGSVNLAILCAVTGAVGGMLYVGVRRWLPGRSTSARGVVFGVLISFGPGQVFLGPVDLTIFEPALPIFFGFAGLFVLYGVALALLINRVSPPTVLLERSSRSSRVAMMVVFAIVVFGLLLMRGIVHDAGTCLSGDDNGGCALRAGKLGAPLLHPVSGA
jgi:hypothetical protein